ncbi:E3 SUMO-protein ligase NSE2-like [Lucilia sericata]|uniref:E3 SUMO-protein ligase NSE2-like n=1 Tax=Lucilia sericata TaxID=13632 RepID=UPI0018A83986|nr:E3 SUMO-protein ligase NSE2-like [Lucilia sericata]
MNAQLNAELDNALQCLLETYHLALEFGDEEWQNPRTYLEMACKLLTTKENAKRMDDAIEVAKEQATVEDFEKEYHNQLHVRLSKKYDPKKSSDFKNFKQQLLQIAQAMEQDGEAAAGSNATRIESDDFVMESEINVYDPLTKQRMQNPVRNTLCNHHYERSSILEAIQINKRLRCPVAGCSNNVYVIQKHLVDDNVFKIRLQKMQEAEADDE